MPQIEMGTANLVLAVKCCLLTASHSRFLLAKNHHCMSCTDAITRFVFDRNIYLKVHKQTIMLTQEKKDVLMI